MLNALQDLQVFSHLLEDLRGGALLPGLGLPRAARLPVASALQRSLGWPLLLVTDRADRALAMLDELGFWLPEVPRQFFPEPNPLFYEQAAWGSTTRRDRLQTLTTLAMHHIPGAVGQRISPVIVTSIRALMTRTLPRRDFIKSTRTIKLGQIIQQDTLLRSWVDVGYQASEVVLEHGQFSRRGGIIDIWPPAEAYPVRLDFFGDEVDTLRQFDPATQRTLARLEQVLITPAREVLPVKARNLPGFSEDMEEFFLPLAHPAPASLLDYLPNPALVLLDDLGNLHAATNEIEEQAVRLRAESIQEGTLPQDFPIPYLTWSELQDSLTAHAALELGRSTAPEQPELAGHFEIGARYGGRLKQVMEAVVEFGCAGDDVTLVSRQIKRLQELWQEHQAQTCAARDPIFLEGTLSEGWVLTRDDGSRLHLLTDSEIFGWERPQPRPRIRQSAEAPESIYADLRPGDWVVHVDYGIGRYTGLVRRTLEGIERDFLCVEYEGGAQLYVPVYQADRLTRYIGPDGETPNATRLGTAEWTQSKQKVREAVLEVARDLLDLYARRQVAVGHPFPPDTVWQQELEASFPYVETADQLKAIREVKNDMETPRPMDRLLCGDVGYGKTEVALRAAFKAVMGGKQVVVLVPTTVLAQQHYETFRQRLAPFPVIVEMLSRFRTPKEQDAILKRFSNGEVDILVGTHRLLGADVLPKDLGLVIVDEEQRFGVTHKEHFKKLRTEVDVLTLTATPIPRTLYMALTGVRDISVINTPPAERLPIITHIGPYSPRQVRQAIVRELERGGQVFFVHNRVQTINAMEAHLRHLVPEARIGIGHGQMPEDQLSAVMQLFTRGEIDVLLCTSIIESGLDIPNANTLIVDRADTFGLAQLYQLRGRVGRGAQRAYAYFFRHKKKPPTVEGQERLEVIADNAQLGAGYSIAMRDLEMRGAGEVLGTRQHGYIAEVGFHLYSRLLAQAVRQLRQIKGLPAPTDTFMSFKEGHMPVSVDLPLSVGIPVEYVPDQTMRLGLYRRLADVQGEAELDAMQDEFSDRFGALPPMVKNLFYAMRIKLLAEQANLAGVAVEGDQLVLRYPPLPEGLSSRNLPALAGVRTGKNAYWMPMPALEEEWKQRLVDTLSAIIKLCSPY